MMRRTIQAAWAASICVLWMAIALTWSVAAQEPAQRSPLGVGQPAPERGITALRPSAAKAAQPPSQIGIADRAWAWVLQTQAQLNRDLVKAVRLMKTDPLWATAVLGWLSFAYGVLHAAGPGHGKAVISAYVLANERTVRRGVLLSFMAAFFQALSALLIVGILSIALKATSLTMKSAEAWIETLSWALVALVGAWLLYGQLEPLFRRGRASAGHAPVDHAPVNHGRPGRAHQHSHDHDHAHGHDHAGCCDGRHDHHDHSHPRTATTGVPAIAATNPDHDHIHNADGSCCDHAHMPSPKDLEGVWSWRKAIALAVSIGIRPCTGAILVLLFALSQGLLLAGVFATFAMALGTAITVSVLAALAVGSRDLATRLAGGGDGRWAKAIASGAGILGSGAVMVMGGAFFLASLKAPSPF